MENQKILKIFVAIFLVVATIFLAILSWNALKTRDYIGVSEEQRHSIMVSGEGEAIGVPDIAKIQLGYSVEKKTVGAAQKDNTEKMNAVIAKLKDEFKIDAKDIKTTNYGVSPMYNWGDGRQTLRGYQVNQNLEVKIREIEKVSQILDISGQLGLNQIGSLTFEIDNEESLRQEARIKAIKAAKEKAETLAREVGVNLGRIISFSESSNQVSPIPYYSNYKVMDESAMGGATPSVEAGSNEIKITATVEYEIL